MNDELIVITGSSKKFGEEIYTLAKNMREEGKTVIVDSMFHLLTEPRARKQFMRIILDADKLLVYNKNSYIGFHTQLEIIIAMVSGIPVEYLFSGPTISIEDLEKKFYQERGR